MIRLDSFDKNEWRDITKRLRPDWSDSEFEAAWAEFIELKRRKDLQ